MITFKYRAAVIGLGWHGIEGEKRGELSQQGEVMIASPPVAVSIYTTLN